LKTLNLTATIAASGGVVNPPMVTFPAADA
jgi:hypothetical protein